MAVYNNILDLIGNTPLVRLNRINPSSKVTIYAKLEAMNPGGSVKDRTALSMIEEAEKKGDLTKDKTVLEATSGNTGIGLAMVCAVKGYSCQLVMPESASIERRKIMEAYGAGIILTSAGRSTDGAIEQTYALARQYPGKYYLTDQFNNEANWQAHYRNTGPEILVQTEGRVTDVVVSMGTSGTAMGLSRYFAEKRPEVRVTAVEPFYGHKIQGLKNMKESYRPEIFSKKLPWQIVNVSDEEAFHHSRLLARREGIFVGMSSGAALVAGLRLGGELEEGVIVVILPDGGERYLSTTLFGTGQVQAGEKEGLRFYNSASQKKEPFKSISSSRVTFYSCGPTVHEPANLSHCRRFVVADLIHRVLLTNGYDVRFLMNFTDLDDNTIAGAEKSGKDLGRFTGEYISRYKQDLDELGVLPASDFPLASEYVDEMIVLARDLVKKGYAYERHGSVYFDVSKFSKYGLLSRVDLNKIKIGKTVDLDDYEKDSPLDFTLLKRSTLSELKKGVFYKSDFGNIRPGWHLECAAIILNLIGETLDIHTSSRDLIFPHHENENAIAEASTSMPLANYWLHSELVLVDGKKMSRENNNLITLQDVLNRGYSHRELRFLLLRTNYRKPLEFSYSKMAESRESLRRLDEFTNKLLGLPPGVTHPHLDVYLDELKTSFRQAIDDDINISPALGSLFNFLKRVNPLLNEGQLDLEQKGAILEDLRWIDSVLNVMKLESGPPDQEIDEFIREREEARKNKNWQKADEVREKLSSMGIKLIDTPRGPVVKH
ncbi:MAG: cysteine--tRNA ligase [Thermodesulfobacteriota bacterium]